MDRHKLKATFFCLGWVARTHPILIQRIAAQGHDLGCHSDVHSLVFSQSPEAFREETARAMGAITDAAGSAVSYYRAPGFSITSKCLWAFDILMDQGITVDCSVFPGSHAHGGTQSLFPGEPFRLRVGERTLMEFPVSLAGGPLQLAFVGGGYFRLLPLPLIVRWTRKKPNTMTYFHPRDFDDEQPRVPGLSILRHFKAYVGIGGAGRKLDAFLTQFGGRSLSQACQDISWDQTPVVTL